MKPLPTWKIAYTIEDGEYEYGDYMLREPSTSPERMPQHWWPPSGAAVTRKRRKPLRRPCCRKANALLPGDGRAITGLGWGRFSPIIITVRNGFVEAVTGVPDDITVEVQDWDNGELDAQGEPVPTVSEWTGPC